MDVGFDLQARYVLKRFALKLAVLSFAAVAQSGTPWGYRSAIEILAIISAALSAGLAALRREQPIGPTLTYWDEALVFFGNRVRG